MALQSILQEPGIKNTLRTWNCIDLFTYGSFREIYSCQFSISKKKII